MPPRGDGRIRPEHLGGREGRDSRRHPANTRTKRLGCSLSETEASGGATAYLKVEKSRFLFLEGSADAAVAPIAAAAAPRDASAAHADTSVARASPSTDSPAAGACSSTSSADLGEGGAGSNLSGVARPPSLSSSSLSDDEYSKAAGGESHCCSRSRYSSSHCSRHSHRRILRSFFRAARPCYRRCAACARSGSGRGRVGPRSGHGHPLLERAKCQNHFGAS
jgi:hypothetical protein